MRQDASAAERYSDEGGSLFVLNAGHTLGATAQLGTDLFVVAVSSYEEKHCAVQGKRDVVLWWVKRNQRLLNQLHLLLVTFLPDCF